MLPDVVQSFFYQGVEMLYTLAFLVGGETTAIFLNGSFGLLTALALAGFAGRVFSREAAWLSVLLWTTTPLVAWLMTTGYVDVGAAFYSFLCTIAAFGWMRQTNWRLAVLAGALAVPRSRPNLTPCSSSWLWRSRWWRRPGSRGASAIRCDL